MKRKTISFLLSLGSLACLCGCSNKSDDANKGFNNQTYDISKNSDNSVKVTISEIEEKGTFKLTLSGNGETKDFSDEVKVPWFSISRKVSEVEIDEGITYLGNEIFSKLPLDSFITPNSLVSLSDSSFKEGTKVYSYASNVESSGKFSIYYYKENRPSDSEAQIRNYWRMVNDSPLVWVIAPIKALFVGNSFTYYNDIPTLTQNICRDLGYDITCDSITKGAHTLEKFADKNDEFGSKVYTKLNSTKDYDYLILQEQSTRSYEKYDSFKNSVATLKKLSDSTQKNCEVRLYSTWGYDAENSENKTSVITTMESKVSECYLNLANELNLKVHQVGKAFTKTFLEHSEINLYHTDYRHPSYGGSYLSALIHAGNLTGHDVRLTKFNGDGSISENEANTLKEVAYSILNNK